MTRGTRKRFPGHGMVRQPDGTAGCECGWTGTDPPGRSWNGPGGRSRHLRQVRMDMAEKPPVRRQR